MTGRAFRALMFAVAVLLQVPAADAFGLRTSLYELVDAGPSADAAEFRRRTENVLLVAAVSDSPGRSAAAARDFIASVPGGYLSRGTVSAGGSAKDFSGKVTGEDAELLRTAEGRAKLARRALRRYIASPVPPLFRPEEDPFCLAEHFVTALASSTNAVLPAVLSPEVAGDIGRLIAAVGDLRERAERANAAAGGGVRLMLGGVPVHTALAAGKCRREIGVLTWFSLGFIVLLSVVVFRSARWIPLLSLSLAVSAAAGFAAVFLCFDSVHVLTLVFGTTVLGLVVDYSFHWLLGVPAGAGGRAADSRLVRNLVVSWATTEVSFLPLAVSSVPVLRETAVFLGAALAAALAAVVFLYPRLARGRAGAASCAGAENPRWRAAWRAAGFVTTVAALVLFALVFPPRVGTDPRAVYVPPAELSGVDRLLAAGWNVDSARERELAADLDALRREWGGKVSEALGVTLADEASADGAAVSVRARIERLLAALTAETARWLLAALALMQGLLFLLFGRGAFRRGFPSLVAVLGTAGIVAVTDGQVNLFHLLAMFLLAGMGVDYAVFLQSGDRAAVKPAVCSLLTSVAGFGALWFVSFPVVRAFGLVLGAGLPVAFLAALAGRRPAETAAGAEVAASPLGLEILAVVYRLLGLRALRAGAAAVGFCAWCCSARVRRAVTGRRKLLLFTRSLADKFAVMAGGRRLPAIRFGDDDDSEAFARDVRAGKGVFVLSSHVGTIEVLSAAAGGVPRFHAWMDFDRTGVFNRFYLGHAEQSRTVIHPVSDIGMETAFAAGEWLDAGECLVMAGDRGDGAFRFAHAMAHPVYFAACTAEGSGYRAHVRRLPDGVRAMKEAYFGFRGELAAEYPDQVFEWNG